MTHPDYRDNELFPEDIITRIFLLRSSNVTSILIASLRWVGTPILRKETKKISSIYYQDTTWVQGVIQLVIDDYLEKKNLKTEQLINSLNQFDYPVIGYPNDLFSAKLKAGYEPITIDSELPEEYKENQKLEIGDIISHLFIEKRINNQSGKDLTSPLARDCLAIAIKTFKRNLISEVHNYTEAPFLRSSPI